jgi:MFS family permease
MTQVKHALFIQGTTAFVSGALSILIPIVLLERNISIQNIGLIFAIYPIVFQLARISFDIISDFFGRKEADLESIESYEECKEYQNQWPEWK